MATVRGTLQKEEVSYESFSLLGPDKNPNRTLKSLTKERVVHSGLYELVGLMRGRDN